MCNTTKTKIKCSDHIYSHSFDTIKHYTASYTCRVKKKQLPPAGKEYLCFQINERSSHTAQCVKSRILNKAIDFILSIDTFEKQRILIKCMLQSSRLEDHMKTIGIEQSLCKRSYFEHTRLNKIKKNISTCR